ncbi:unnamed protein product [Linum trigynum]|uniref:Uncharacterized protein n=1 Tax=Linum trigynum TaxID=586398 RepID=A0AAV2F6H6_9ROSI
MMEWNLRGRLLKIPRRRSACRGRRRGKGTSPSQKPCPAPPQIFFHSRSFHPDGVLPLNAPAWKYTNTGSFLFSLSRLGM